MPYKVADNLFLAKLPDDCLERLTPGLEWAELPVGEAVTPEPVTAVYFPVNGLMSFVLTSEAGISSEVAVAGKEGLAGFCIFFNSRTPVIPAVVQKSGVGLKLAAAYAIEEFRRRTEFQFFILTYFRAFFRQVAQTSLCNAQHGLEQRFCRWLLMCNDRLPGDDHVAMSQETIANMLGVRREAVTRVAKQLKSRELIDYGTRRIEIVDRAGLMAASCECYTTLKVIYDQFLQEPYVDNLRFGQAP